MHYSRMCGFIIDSKVDDLEVGANFWSEALGFALIDDGQLEEGKYAALDAGSSGLVVEVQKVRHESRVHLDIETDDLDAEVARLEKLGAKRVEFVHKHWVMKAPAGHKFCVLPAESKDFPRNANRWE